MYVIKVYKLRAKINRQQQQTIHIDEASMSQQCHGSIESHTYFIRRKLDGY